MEPICYVDRLNDMYKAQGFPPYRWTVNTEAPFTPLEKPLSECRVSVLTSGGISRRSAEPFNAGATNDFRVDAIDKDAPSDDFQIHDAFYDHRDADTDLNCVFPIDRLRELADEGIVGGVAPRHWSGFMGRIFKRSIVLNETAPALVEELHTDDVDLFLLVPA